MPALLRIRAYIAALVHPGDLSVWELAGIVGEDHSHYAYVPAGVCRFGCN